MWTKEEILEYVRRNVERMKQDLDKVEPSVKKALEASYKDRDRSIEAAFAAADINEGGDLRMGLVSLLRDFQDEQDEKEKKAP